MSDSFNEDVRKQLETLQRDLLVALEVVNNPDGYSPLVRQQTYAKVGASLGTFGDLFIQKAASENAHCSCNPPVFAGRCQKCHKTPRPAKK